MNDPPSDTGTADKTSERAMLSVTNANDSQEASVSAVYEASIENARAYIGKYKTVWSKALPYVHQIPYHNVLLQWSGPHRSTDTFKKIIAVEMVDLIVWYTNNKANKVHHNCNAKNPDSQRLTKLVTILEMYALIGILIC